jgi:hypothetical protein
VVLEVTATSPDGKQIFKTERIYMPQASDSKGPDMVLGPDKKLGLIRDTSLQPFAPKEETIEIDLPQGLASVVLQVNLSYQPRPGDVYPVHAVTKRLSLAQ